MDFTCSQVQGVKVAAAAKGWVHKVVEHFGSKMGSYEGFERSELGDFLWLQLLAKLEHLSLTSSLFD